MIQTLVSVPPQFDAWLRTRKGRLEAPLKGLADYVGSDPEGRKLGSGGGTVSLLYRAWRETGRGMQLGDWIRSGRKLVLHAGGESRRLPAYASAGKALLPVPFAPEGQPLRFDQALSHFQVPSYRQVLREAGRDCALMVASGDVWLEFDPLTLPSVHSDIAGIGMRVAPEIAQHFGVFFVAKANGASARGRSAEQRISFFKQKPSPEEIYRHSTMYDTYVDTGLWLFSAAAVEFLFRRCGWEESARRFAGGAEVPEYLDLYTEIGTALGQGTRAPAALARHGWKNLTRSVIPLDDARFFHVGSSRQLLESYEQLASRGVERQKVFSFATPSVGAARQANLPVWVDCGGSGDLWDLDGMNVVTGTVPRGRRLRLRQEQCLEIAPVGQDSFVIRPYHIDDSLRGTPDANGKICGQPAAEWLRSRGLEGGNEDVFLTPVYPVVSANEVTQDLVEWFFASEPSPAITQLVRGKERLRACDIPARIAFERYFDARSAGHTAVLLRQFSNCMETGDTRVFGQDFAAVADQARRDRRLRTWLLAKAPALLARLTRPEHASRLLMLLAGVTRGRTRAEFELQAHQRLQQGVITSDQVAKAQPRLALKDDQIVWGRSPVRFDLAGGWTDTPPYCLEKGGSVLNMAVLLNGQPPIQVFVRPLPETVISLRSIDLGVSEVVKTYAGLESFRDPRSGFSLPKAALAMAGFLPEFYAGRAATTLQQGLRRFGGGLEISLLSAVPKGSGLGTSSILAATILGALNRACSLNWDEVSLYNRVLGVEQLLTTGGGWQDQAGALFRGIKFVETSPGSAQTPSVRYLPQHLFGPAYANQTMLLYYTGITRLAKGILKEIVHDMFLGRFDTMQTLGFIRSNSHALFAAVQQNDPAMLHRCIGRSWDLNKRLDPGTTTPEIDEILAVCGADLAAAKLLGAGGGGYMILCAKSAEAGRRIRAKLEQNPPNSRARFIDFQVAEAGLEVTVS